MTSPLRGRAGRSGALGGAGPALLGVAALCACVGSSLAQVEQPLPYPHAQGQADAQAGMRAAAPWRHLGPVRLPPGPRVKAVQVGNAWMLELAAPPGGGAQQAADADADRARQWQAAPGRFRTVSTAVGAWMIEDTEATPAPATTALPAGARIVDLRTAEDFARAMAAPEPMVVYRVVK